MMKKILSTRYFQSIILISCLFLLSGTSYPEATTLKKSIKECFPNQTVGKNYCLFVLADTPQSCPSCNISFCEFLKGNVIDKPNCFIVMYTTGSRYDIGDLLAAKNAYNDRKTQKFLANGYKFETSEVIIVKNDKIDTIIHMEPQSIRKTLPYLSQRIQNMN